MADKLKEDVMGKALTHLILGWLESLGSFCSTVVYVCWTIFKNPPKFSLVRDQMFSIGVLSLPVVAVTGFSIGMVLAAQSFFQLADKGLEGATGIMVAKAMTVEIGPVLTAFMVTGRVGAAMCAELGTMRVTEQVDAIRSMAIDPYRYLIAPRYIAGTLMMPLLMIFGGLMGIFGGYLMAVYYFHMDPNAYMSPIPVYMRVFDIFSGFIKSLFFGILIVTISCYRGLNTRGGASGVGLSTTKSVVTCYSCILLVNFILTLSLNSIYYQFMGAVRWLTSFI